MCVRERDVCERENVCERERERMCVREKERDRQRVAVCVCFDSATPWTTVSQAPLSMGFPKQEY